MSQDMESIMQAAERLRAYDIDKLLRDAEPYSLQWDLLHMAKSYRRILPKGKRPVAMDLSAFNPGDKFWGIRYGYDIQFGDVGFSKVHERNTVEWWDIAEYGIQGYRTEDDARLALHWQKLDELAALTR